MILHAGDTTHTGSVKSHYTATNRFEPCIHPLLSDRTALDTSKDAARPCDVHYLLLLIGRFGDLVHVAAVRNVQMYLLLEPLIVPLSCSYPI